MAQSGMSNGMTQLSSRRLWLAMIAVINHTGFARIGEHMTRVIVTICC